MDLLAFKHPLAGKQFVKGSIEAAEHPKAAAARELLEESGLSSITFERKLARVRIGATQELWHFYSAPSANLPEHWMHRAPDDGGHDFSFFWHPLAQDLDRDWHPIFHEALAVIRQSLSPFEQGGSRG